MDKKSLIKRLNFLARIRVTGGTASDVSRLVDNLFRYGSLFLLSLSSFGLATSLPALKMFELKDGPQLTQYLQGEVLLIGKDFPGKYFQRAVLEKLKSRQIKVRVVTGIKDQKMLLPIQKAGGQVRALPTSVTGGLVITEYAVLAPRGNTWRVVTGVEVITPIKKQFEDAWQLTKRFAR